MIKLCRESSISPKHEFYTYEKLTNFIIEKRIYEPENNKA